MHGLGFTKGDLIVLMDADLSHHVRFLSARVDHQTRNFSISCLLLGPPADLKQVNELKTLRVASKDPNPP